MTEPPQTPPPPQPPPPAGSGRPGAGLNADQMKAAVRGAHPYDLGMIAAGVVAFIFSLFSYYTVSVNVGAFGTGSGSESAWHGFFGWFGVLVALAVAALLALRLLGVRLLDGPTTRLVSMIGFAVATVCALLALLIWPGKLDCNGNNACENALDYGHGIGYWVSTLAIIVGLVLSYLRKDAEA